MPIPDFNLLIVLDALLAEKSVTRAADRLRLSPSAMSRALARLRKATGDPLLVMAGRDFVPTPRAVELWGRVCHLVEEGREVLRPVSNFDLKQVVRTFTFRTSDGFVENFGPALIARLGREAPGLRIRFLPKVDRATTLLREGTVDLETGVVGDKTDQEIIVRPLFLDHFVGVVRKGHPLSDGPVTKAQYLDAQHILVSRRGLETGPIDETLEQNHQKRNIVAIVGGFFAALALARGSDLVASVPERHTGSLRSDMTSFPLPVFAPEIRVSLLWHPRMEVDPTHRWLRDCISDICSEPSASRPLPGKGQDSPLLC